VPAQPATAPVAPAEGGSPAPAAGETPLVAPIPGLVIRYLVQEGDQVERGTPVLVLEAMKMENTLPRRRTAGQAGAAEGGDAVVRGDVLAVIG